MDCNNCSKGKEKNRDFTLVGMLAASNRRMFIALMTALILLCGSWIGFFVYESQFEDVSVSQEVDTGDGDAFVAGVGDVNYGESKTDSQN